MPALVAHMARRVDGIDVASGGELRVALDAGVDPREISFAGPGKSEAELAQAVAAGILRQCRVAARSRAARGASRATLGLPRARRRARQSRFRAQVVGHEDGRRPEAVRRRRRAGARRCSRASASVGLAFEGFHIFCGSQNLKRGLDLRGAARRSFELARPARAGARRRRCASLNLGGGFGIPYFPGRTAARPRADRRRTCAASSSARAARCRRRALVDRARPLPRRRSRHLRLPRRRPQDLARPGVPGDRRRPASSSRGSGNFGQVIRKNYPVAIGNRDRRRRARDGLGRRPLCTPLDLLADRMDLAEAEPGDLVVVFQSGAYGATASPQGFLSHPHLVEVLV